MLYIENISHKDIRFYEGNKEYFLRYNFHKSADFDYTLNNDLYIWEVVELIYTNDSRRTRDLETVNVVGELVLERHTVKNSPKNNPSYRMSFNEEKFIIQLGDIKDKNKFGEYLHKMLLDIINKQTIPLPPF